MERSGDLKTTLPAETSRQQCALSVHLILKFDKLGSTPCGAAVRHAGTGYSLNQPRAVRL